jgi:hypothetical protein
MKIYRRTLIYLLGKACKFNVLRYRWWWSNRWIN